MAVNIPIQNVKYNRPKEYFRHQSTICNVRYKDQSGAGAIYGFQFPEGTWRTLFITCNQTVMISDVQEIDGLKLEFKEETVDNVNVTSVWAKYLWTSPRDQLNVTVIEFSPTALKALSRMRYARLLSATPQTTEKITISDFEGRYVSGTIVNVIGDIIQYKPDTETSVGSPLLNKDWDVVGINIGLWYATTEHVQTTFKAINIQSILTAFAKSVNENVKPDDELWLEKINLLSSNEFEYIGGGGYGQVYKIKLKAEVTELAVKIVHGIGKIDDCKSQVVALKKEYSMVIH